MLSCLFEKKIQKRERIHFFVEQWKYPTVLESGETVIVRSKREGVINTGALLFIYFFNFTHIYYYNGLGHENKELLLGKKTYLHASRACFVNTKQWSVQGSDAQKFDASHGGRIHRMENMWFINWTTDGGGGDKAARTLRSHNFGTTFDKTYQSVLFAAAAAVDRMTIYRR